MRLLASEEELHFLVSILLDRASLARHGASFGESLYALRRAPVGGADGAAPAEMSCAQRHGSLALLTLVPYLRAKADALHARHARGAAAGGGVLALALRRAAASADSPAGTTSPQDAPAAPTTTLAAWRARLQPLALRLFLAAYPYVASAHEGARFAYQLLYLLGRSPYYSPELHALRLTVARASAADAAAAAAAAAAGRAARAARLGGGLAARLAAAGDAAADHVRGALILAVFGYKLLEWWYASAEAKLGGGRALPAPPPPPALAPHPAGARAPGGGGSAACALCGAAPRVNPAMVATSGYVFCYRCAFEHVERHGCCPVTRVAAGLEHVRRLYPGGA